MSSMQRLRLALAWEQARVPVLLAVVGLLAAGSYLPSIARLEAAAAITLVPVLAVGYALRSVWHEPFAVRFFALPVALVAGGGAMVAIWGGAGPWQPPVAWLLWAATGCAAFVQLFAARRGTRTFFAVAMGIVLALGLTVPYHVNLADQPGSALGALLVALVAGGGVGVATVALGERVAVPQAGRRD